VRKQGRLLAIEALRDRGKLEPKRDVRPDDGEPVMCGKMIEPFAQRRDRPREIAASDGV
jgi:hypothetical protein